MAELSLSVCILARNEQANLPDAIASVRDVAGEVVVTDTGSTDDTPALAQSLGACVSQFPWCDDFSAGWNHGMSIATGDWVLILDADERLLPQSHAELRKMISQADVLASYVIRRDLMARDQPSHYTQMALPRLVRRDHGVRFVGRCHPHPDRPLVESAATQHMRVTKTAIALEHYGYVDELRPAKLERGARLMAMELEDRPGQLYYQIELLRTYLLLNDDRAKTMLEQAASGLVPYLDEARAPLPQAALLLETLLQWPVDQLPTPFTPAMLRQLSERWFNDSPPLIWLLAGQDFAQGRYVSSCGKLRRLVQMGQNHSYDDHTSFDPAIVGDEAKLNLAACLIKQAKVREARGILRPLVNSSRVGDRARANLDVVRQLLRS